MCIRDSNEQSESLKQLNDAMGQMDKITQSSAASSEETAAAAQQMSAQSQELLSTVEELDHLVGHAVEERDVRGDSADAPPPPPSPVRGGEKRRVVPAIA